MVIALINTIGVLKSSFNQSKTRMCTGGAVAFHKYAYQRINVKMSKRVVIGMSHRVVQYLFAQKVSNLRMNHYLNPIYRHKNFAL